jgi:mannose-1-phosphate guanylyltransferase
MSKNNFAIIMAGGIGSRFWPTSTPDFPKQFHDMTGTGQSLLQQTFHRLENTIPPEQIFIVTHASYQAIILDQLEGKISSDQIICEPEQRNTAPCILLASLKIKKINSKARIVVTPSDHLILDEELFTEDINLALKATDEKNLITFGIQPDHPATGFGYIAVDKVSDARFLPVLEFTELKIIFGTLVFLCGRSRLSSQDLKVMHPTCTHYSTRASINSIQLTKRRLSLKIIRWLKRFQLIMR